MTSSKDKVSLYDERIDRKKDDGILYCDEWSEIRNGELTITWYYFPIATSLKIKTSNIKGIYYRVQNLSNDIGVTKNWGMSLSPCWWACDMKRGFRSNAAERGFYNVAIDCGEGTLKGFTTNNIHGFLGVLRPQIGFDCIIRNEFPW